MPETNLTSVSVVQRGYAYLRDQHGLIIRGTNEAGDFTHESFKTGVRVRIEGLKSNPELNSTEGSIV